jgi:hypothetical protein
MRHTAELKVLVKTAQQLVAWILDCQVCGLRVHWVLGEGARVGH